MIVATSFFDLSIPAWQIVVRSLVIYLAFLLVLRFFGKREVGQFTLTDLILILLVANAVQPAMTGPDTSLLGGLIIVATLFLTNLALSYLRVRSSPVRKFLEGEPAVIGKDGAWIQNVMRREGVDQDEAEMALREHGVGSIEEAELVVLEVDGTVSVVPKEGGGVKRGRRRVRYLKRG
jgi:uncharacterized membrane protein YcaP (DUF421 family)